jgi:multicomponent Na+:H+ antiporter subunit E
MILWNLLLALVWVFASGRFSIENLLLGWVLGLAILTLTLPERRGTYALRVWRVALFVLFFMKESVVSALRVAHDVLTPRARMRPGVIGVPLDDLSDAAITLLANLVTLTPGSLTLDVSRDRKTLFVHVMFLHDVERTRRHLKEEFERRVKEVVP